MFEWMDTRAKTIPLGENHWWRNLARAIVARDSRGYRVLGADLAKHVKRKNPFGHGMLSAFANNTAYPRDTQIVSVTYEFAEALCAEFPTLPPPVFIPRSYPEAVQFMAVQERFKDEPPNDPGNGYIVPTARRRRRTREQVAQQSAPNDVRVKRVAR